MGRGLGRHLGRNCGDKALARSTLVFVLVLLAAQSNATDKPLAKSKALGPPPPPILIASNLISAGL